MTRDEYLQRMATCKKFAFFGVEPVWNPERPDIDGFITDEVVRQGHDPNWTYDGGIRIRQMRTAWNYAKLQIKDAPIPTLKHVLDIAWKIEDINAEGLRHHEVRIGENFGAPFKLLPVLVEIWVDALENIDGTRLDERTVPPFAELQALWRYAPPTEIVERFTDYCAQMVTVDDAYLAFEGLHPFGDGNGRTGKIIYNWLAGTLDHPILVRDWFGGGNP